MSVSDDRSMAGAAGADGGTGSGGAGGGAEGGAGGAEGLSLPPPPREMTPAVKKALDRDPRVRTWVVLAGLAFGVAVYLGVQKVREWMADRWLVTSGTVVEAKIVEAAGVPQEGRRQPWSELMKLRFTLPDGTEHTVTGRFREMPGGQNMVVVGQTVAVKVDPQRPTRWTDRKEPPSVWPSLVSVYLLMPVSLAMLLWGAWTSRRLRGLWRRGEVVPAAVLSVSSSPLAPGSFAVTAATAGREGSPLKVYVPRRLPDGRPRQLHRGDVVWVLSSSPRGGLAVAVSALPPEVGGTAAGSGVSAGG
ncbi:MAG: DUF3592 domain-containing protein [Tepidisphaerales bacterium]